MAGLTKEQYLLLEMLTYLDDDEPFRKLGKNTEGLSVEAFLASINVDAIEDDRFYHSKFRGWEWKSIIERVKKDKKLRKMRIAATHTDEEYGGESTLFVDEEDKEAVVAFRGTAPAEWVDNIRGAAPASEGREPDTECQKKALAWYQDIYRKHQLKDYKRTVIGHSKGGNKVKYITIKDDTVDQCLSFDGQGFSDDFIYANKEQIARNQHKISNHNVAGDFVNVLLNDVGKSTYYEGSSISEFARNHCPAALLDLQKPDSKMAVAEGGRSGVTTLLHDMLNSFCRSIPKQEVADTVEVLGKTVSNVMRQWERNFAIEKDEKAGIKSQEKKVSPLTTAMSTLQDESIRDKTGTLAKMTAYAGMYFSSTPERQERAAEFIGWAANSKFVGKVAVFGLKHPGLLKFVSRVPWLFRIPKEARPFLRTFADQVSAAKESGELQIRDSGKDLDAQKLVEESKEAGKEESKEQELEPELSPQEQLEQRKTVFEENIAAGLHRIAGILRRHRGEEEPKFSAREQDGLQKGLLKVLTNVRLHHFSVRTKAQEDPEKWNAVTSQETIQAAEQTLEKEDSFRQLVQNVTRETYEALAAGEGKKFPQEGVEALYQKFLTLSQPAKKVKNQQNQYLQMVESKDMEEEPPQVLPEDQVRRKTLFPGLGSMNKN